MSVLRPVQPPPPVAPYHPPPAYPPPQHGTAQPFDNRALIALEVAIVGLVLGVPLGVPGLVCGPVAYFMGRSAAGRLEASGSAGPIAWTASPKPSSGRCAIPSGSRRFSSSG